LKEGHWSVSRKRALGGEHRELPNKAKFERCLELLKALIAKKSSHVTALYNAGQACMKLMRKQEAVDYFNEYYKRNPQSWWASVATEHIQAAPDGSFFVD